MEYQLILKFKTEEELRAYLDGNLAPKETEKDEIKATPEAPKKEEPTEKVDLALIQKLMSKLLQEGTTTKVRASIHELLESFGVKGLSKLNKTDYPAFYEKLKALEA